MNTPRVSIIIPTLNAAAYLDECLSSIRRQTLRADELEIIIADGGSTDATFEIAAKHHVDRIVDNPLRTGESGKAVAIRAARAEVLLSIDSDNVLVGDDWLERILAPFDDAGVWATQAIAFDYRSVDNALVRYTALLGAGDPLAVYVGNYDRMSALTGQWTGCPHEEEERRGWRRVTIDPRHVPTLGANGFAFRLSALTQDELARDYFFDIDVAAAVIRRGHRVVGIVDVAIRHYFCRDLSTYRRKTRRRVDDYMFHRSTGERTYPWPSARRGMVRFVVSTVLVLPIALDAARGWRRVPDSAWLLHVPVCWITLITYAWGVARGLIRPQAMDRSSWRQ